MARTVFVGDVHGCAAELQELLAEAEFVPGSDRLLLTGDAFSRGPEPLGVWDAIGATGAAMVLGNHDDRLLRQLRNLAGGSGVRFRRPHHSATYEELRPVAEKLLPWLESLPLCIEDGALDNGGFALAHAGLNPDGGVAGTRREEFLTIRTWPPNGTLEGPRWHDAIEPPAGTIIFGHDAPGGLTVRRLDGADRPWLVGLDSGCVYGGSLSAWVLEEDRLIQVPSRQPRR